MKQICSWDCDIYLNIGDCRPDVGGRVHFEAKLALEYCIHQVTQRLGRASWVKQLPLVVPLGFEEPISDKLHRCQVPEKIFACDISLNISDAKNTQYVFKCSHELF
jgi:hypothetical protein